MESNIKRQARRILSNYIEKSNHRKTPERYAILDAIFDIKGHFSLEELNAILQKKNFIVSRATLFNNLKLFIELNLIVRHKFADGTKYEACIGNTNHSHQICTICNKVTELNIPEISAIINRHRFRRFRKEEFSLYVYGVCSSCQAKLTRNKNTNNQIRKHT